MHTRQHTQKQNRTHRKQKIQLQRVQKNKQIIPWCPLRVCLYGLHQEKVNKRTECFTCRVRSSYEERTPHMSTTGWGQSQDLEGFLSLLCHPWPEIVPTTRGGDNLLSSGWPYSLLRCQGQRIWVGPRPFPSMMGNTFVFTYVKNLTDF